MLQPYLKIWDWDLIFGRAVKVISSLGVRSPCSDTICIVELTGQITAQKTLHHVFDTAAVA